MRANEEYDVVVVGARVAGAATALLTARAGYRVLLLDRCRRGSDTLSTHALMRPGVLQLHRWGVLPDIVAQGTPAQHKVIFHYGNDPIPLDVAGPLYAPRRTVLDSVLASAAERAGADVRFGVGVRTLLRDDDGRVQGVRLREPDGQHRDVGARMTVAADGRNSRLAREVRAPVTHRGSTTTAFVLGYWSGVATEGYEWCFRPATAAGLIPTNDGEVCVFVGTPPDRFAGELRHDLEAGVHRVLKETTPQVAERVAAGQLVGPLRAYPGLDGWLRRPWGPGWALVGDSGYFKDPITAHGMTDALRDAELLVRAIRQSFEGGAPWPTAAGAYEMLRNRLSEPMFDITNAVAGFDWDLAEVQRLHLDMSAVMKDEYRTLVSLDELGDRALPA